jgi:hypothetical protein
MQPLEEQRAETEPPDQQREGVDARDHPACPQRRGSQSPGIRIGLEAEGLELEARPQMDLHAFDRDRPGQQPTELHLDLPVQQCPSEPRGDDVAEHGGAHENAGPEEPKPAAPHAIPPNPARRRRPRAG